MGKNRKWIFIERELTRMRREFEKNNSVVPKVKGLVRNGNAYCVTRMQPKTEHVADGFIDKAERPSLDERMVLLENSAEEHGDEATCLWLKNLPPLVPIKIVDKGERILFKSGKSQPKWYSDAFVKSKSHEERRTMRSKIFAGMARALAEQWTRF